MSTSGDISALLGDIEQSRFTKSVGVDPDTVKKAIRLLRAVDSVDIHECQRYPGTNSSSISESDPRSRSYSEQRSIILDDFNRRTCRARSPRPISVGTSHQTHPSLTSKQSLISRVESRPRPHVQRDFLSTPDISLEAIRPTVRAIRDHIRSLGRDIQDLLQSDSYSLIDMFELLVSLDCPGVSEEEIDLLLLHLSVNPYWEEGYFSNVSRKTLIEFFSCSDSPRNCTAHLQSFSSTIRSISLSLSIVVVVSSGRTSSRWTPTSPSISVRRILSNRFFLFDLYIPSLIV